MIIKFEKRTMTPIPFSWTKEEIEAHNELIEMHLAEDMKQINIFAKETSESFLRHYRPPPPLAGIEKSTS